jgi:hypothetical protein
MTNKTSLRMAAKERIAERGQPCPRVQEFRLTVETGIGISWRRIFIFPLVLPLIVICSGCHVLKITEPSRSVTEQLLLSTATDRAVERVDLSILKDKKVFVDEKYLESYDKAYVAGTIREYISKNDAFLVDDKSKSEIVVEIRSGGLGLDLRESLIGIPDLTLPVPMAGPVSSPELALYKTIKADSLAKFVLFAYERETGDFVHSTGSMAGKAKFHHYKILGIINWRITDIPELKSKFRNKSDPKYKPVDP